MSTSPIGIVDLFSGPGGLGEGFSTVCNNKGEPVFEIDLSVEFDAVAHKTLRLRSFLRKVPGGFPAEYYDWMNGLTEEPDWKSTWPKEWAEAEMECRHLELGTQDATDVLMDRIPEIRFARGEATILIGGPPCQAYSLAGRSRKSAKGFAPHPKNRHLLYREYIGVLRMLEPAAFVMENVKGLLSSHTADAQIVDQVLADLRSGGGSTPYLVFPLAAPEGADVLNPKPADFVVRAENHGVPQARHRVIIVGIRKDLADQITLDELPVLDKHDTPATVEMVLNGLPELRSLLSSRSGTKDSDDAWASTVRKAALRVRRYAGRSFSPNSRQKFEAAIGRTLNSASNPPPRVSRAAKVSTGTTCPASLTSWLLDPAIFCPTHHEPRAHIPGDLERYLFTAAWNQAFGSAPKAANFPKFLAPSHESWGKGFADRFRVQSGGRPSSTVTCHLSKDGHYFIHPDPAQVRSLTVREAARLQTFPDNYHFVGTRTQAYVQVGNAVPPFLAHQIGSALAKPLVKALEAAASVSAAITETCAAE